MHSVFEVALENFGANYRDKVEAGELEHGEEPLGISSLKEAQDEVVDLVAYLGIMEEQVSLLVRDIRELHDAVKFPVSDYKNGLHYDTYIHIMNNIHLNLHALSNGKNVK